MTGLNRPLGHAPGVAMLSRLAVILGILAATPAQAGIEGLAFVLADGTLKIGTQVIRLHGIYLPPTGRTCQTRLQPTRCGPRAVLELKRKIHGFVTCQEVARDPDRKIAAICTGRGDGPSTGHRQDLAAHLLRSGWAVARPNAPFEYHTFEKIARVKRRGIWGFQADSIHGR